MRRAFLVLPPPAECQRHGERNVAMPDQLGSPGLYSLSFWHLRLPPFLIAIRSQLSGLIVFSREVSLVVRRPNGRNVLATSFCGGTEVQSESQPSVQRDLTAAKHFLRLACDSNPPRRQCGVERNCCLIHASIAVTKWQNADSARRCRFRKSQQKRASDLDSIDGWIPKLDVAGSNPVSRSFQ